MAKRPLSPVAAHCDGGNGDCLQAAKDARLDTFIAGGNSGTSQAEQSSSCVEVTKLDGESLFLHTSPDDSIHKFKVELTKHLQLGCNISIKLLCQSKVLQDDLLIRDLPEPVLQIVRVRTPHMALIKLGVAGSAKYRAAGVLAANGSAFFAPCDAPRVLRVDPVAKTAECIGHALAGTDKYDAGGVLANDGSVYFAPRDAERVLRIDPKASAVETVGPELAGEDKYLSGGVKSGSGSIYFAPCDSEHVLCVTPGVSAESTRVEAIGPELMGRQKYVASGVLAGDGCIYFAPCSADRVLCIDPQADESQAIHLIGPELPTPEGRDGKYTAGGVLARNGCIYFAPLCSGRVLRVDPSRRDVDTIGPYFDGDKLYESDGVLAPNACIYFAPLRADGVLCINPDTGNCHQIRIDGVPRHVPANKKYLYMGKGALAADECIYFSPSGADRLLRIDPSTSTAEFFGSRLKAGRFHYQTGFVQAEDGLLISAPYDSQKALCLKA